MMPLDLLSMGVSVIPVGYRTKKPEVRWRTYQDRLPTEQEISVWFRPGRQVNYAAVCGWNGLTVLDFDDTTKYTDWLMWCIGEQGAAGRVAMRTYRVLTRRGVHVYMFVKDAPRCGHFAGGDIKGRGGYVLIPPSVHPSGAIYAAWDHMAPIMTVKTLADVLPDPPPEPVPAPLLLTTVYRASSLWPESTVERIHHGVDILGLLPPATKTGPHWYMVCCPFHEDHHASMCVDTQRGICGCYAGCTPKPFDVIDLYARLHGMDNRAAIKELVRGLPDDGLALAC